MSRRETEHKGEKTGNRGSCCPAHRADALAVGGYKRSRERESMSVSPFSRAATFSYEGPGPSFYRCKERVQVYNGGCSDVLTCPVERSQSPMYADVAAGEVLVPCSCDVVAVGGAFEPCRSTAVGVVGSLLTSPCFRRGLRTAVVMGARGVPSLLVYRGEPDGTPVLCSP
jgi:hypothetical protein